jgi:hypothetical protein
MRLVVVSRVQGRVHQYSHAFPSSSASTMFATRLLAVALLRSARPALQTTYQHHLPRYQRSFSASSTSRSSPKPSTPDSLTEFNEELQRSSLWKKLAGHPEAIAAIRDFGRLIQMSGKCPYVHHCPQKLTYCVTCRYRSESGQTFSLRMDETC